MRENDVISDNDLHHVFKKVDIDDSGNISSTVRILIDHLVSYFQLFKELRLACRYLCKQFQIDIKTVHLKIFFMLHLI